jgi:uncharacterized membrane protein YhaH (DUF805 family)
MSFMEAVAYCLTNYVQFRGRGSRSEFWWFALAYFLAGAAPYLFLVGGAFILDIVGRPEILGYVGLIMLLTVFYCSFITLFGGLAPLLAATSRRLHDTDRSVRWILTVAIPFIGPVILLALLACRGSEGPNRFGPAVEAPHCKLQAA